MPENTENTETGADECKALLQQMADDIKAIKITIVGGS